MKLAILILIRTSQGVLISVGIPTLVVIAVLFAWVFFLFISMHQLRDLLPARTNSTEYLNIYRVMQTKFKRFYSINVAINTIRTPNLLQIKNK